MCMLSLSAEHAQAHHIYLFRNTERTLCGVLHKPHAAATMNCIENVCFGDRRCLEDVKIVAFSPNSAFIACVRSTTVYVRDLATSETKTTLELPCISVSKSRCRNIKSVAFSPDSKLLATFSDDSMVRLWSVADGKPLLQFQVCDGAESRVFFSPDGTFLCHTSTAGIADLWNIESKSRVAVFDENAYLTVMALFSPDSTLFAVPHSSEIRVFSTATGTQVSSLIGHQCDVTSISFSPDGKLMASCAMESNVIVWDVKSGNQKRVLRGHLDWVRKVIFSPDGTYLASSSDDQSIIIWCAISGQKTSIIWHNRWNWIHNVWLSPDGKAMVCTVDDEVPNSRPSAGAGGLYIYNVEKGTLMSRLRTSTINRHDEIQFSADGTLLASMDEKGVARLSSFWRPLQKQIQRISLPLLQSKMLSVHVVVEIVNKMRTWQRCPNDWLKAQQTDWTIKLATKI